MREPPSTIEIDREVVGMIPSCSDLLEVACAHGRTAFDLEAMGYRVTAVDLDPDAIKNCVETKKRESSSVEFMIADGRELPYDDSSFDAVIMNGFLTMLTDRSSRNRAISESCRVLRKGGFLYIADFLQTWSSDIYRSRYEKDRGVTGEMGTFIVTEEGVEIYWAHHHTKEELMGLLGNDFSVITMKERIFRSFHGNSVDGIVMLAKRSDTGTVH